MATAEECRAALARLSAHLAANAEEVRSRVNVDRTVACRVTDLRIAFRGRLVGGELTEITDGDDPDAQVTVTATSDDLIALINGDLDFLKAVTTRRVSISANPWDLLKLRNLR